MEETTNSLFAYRRDNERGESEIGVGCVRHLNNLRKSKYIQKPDIPVFVVQMNSIDFHGPGVEMTSFAPIENDTLFENKKAVYDGGENTLTGFVIEEPEMAERGTGLFRTVKYSTLKNIRLTDCAVTGRRLTGALAGTVDSASVINCGVFLSTKDEYGRHNDMENRINTYKVAGDGSVGGLIGNSLNSAVTDCFAAVSVTGIVNVGGLIGYQSGGTVKNSYSSGDVTTEWNGGGLTGDCENCQVSGCYSTSDVTSPAGGGGLAGVVSSSSVINCQSYGQVLPPEGFTGEALGGFVGSLGSGSSFLDCWYLKQAKYNDQYTDSSIFGIQAGYYQQLKSGKPNAAENSEPYSSTLVRNAFPFPQLHYSDVAEERVMCHYGDWPAELKLQTSLVYYERYREEDGTDSYGYYAVTSLTASNGLEEGKETNTWKVDTLQDRVCIEGGYAIITPYALTSFQYRLNADLTGNAGRPVTVSTGTGESQSALLGEDVSLTFVSKGESGKEIEYTISNCYIFRLPFKLQMADRQTAARFYDQLKVTGYVGDNEVFTDYTFYYCPDFAKNAINPSLSEKDAVLPADPDSVKKEYVYVRSARQLNALGRNQYYWNVSKSTGEDKSREFGFKQETDIDFGKYAADTKTYCGVPFDLMDTSASNPYRNVPIGRPNVGSDLLVANNFRYGYDGGGHKIIDYCCSSENLQFVGLFGEVQYGTIENVIMTASSPEGGSAYVESSYYDNVEQKAKSAGTGALVGLLYVAPPEDGGSYSGKVATVRNCAVSGYRVSYLRNDWNAGSVNADVAIGGLAGFNFGRIENSTVVNKVTELNVSNARGYKMVLGGLVGSIDGKGTVRGCYSGGDVSLISSDIGSGSGIGGICGGQFHIYGYGYDKYSAGIFNSYSYCSWKRDAISSAGSLACYGVTFNDCRLSNCYYLKDEVGAEISISGVDGVEGLTAREMMELDESRLSGFDWATRYSSYPWPEDEDRLGGSAYPFPAAVYEVGDDGKTGERVHYGSWPETERKAEAVYLCYYEKYEDGSYGFYYLDEADNIQRSLDDSNASTIVDTGYGVICGADKRFDVMYEEWLQNPLTGKKTGTEVLEEKPILSLGDGNLFLYQFDQDFERSYVEISVTYPVSNRGLAFLYQGETGITVRKEYYLNTRFAADIQLKRTNDGQERMAEVRTAEQLEHTGTGSYGRSWTFFQTHFITADASTGNINNNTEGFTYDGQENAIYGLRQPLFSQNGGRLCNIRIVDAEITAAGNTAALVDNSNIRNSEIVNCSVTGTITSTGGSAAGITYQSGGSVTGCYVYGNISAAGNASGLVGIQLNSEIKNCSFIGSVTSTGQSAAGLVGVNGGPITNCFAYGTVTANGNAAGLVGENGSPIANCFAYGTVTANGNAAGLVGVLKDSAIQRSYANCKVSGRNAAGFVYKSVASVNDCYSVGSVTASETAAGFFCEGWVSLKNCYTVSEVLTGTVKYGFGNGEVSNISNCYWVSVGTFNRGIGDYSRAEKLTSFGTLASDDMVKTLNNSTAAGVWTKETGHTHPETLTGDYPYPRITVLDHYGDWPVVEDEGENLTDVGTIGVYQAYYEDWSKTYYAAGSCYDMVKSKTYDMPNSGGGQQSKKYCVMFSKDIDVSKWYVTYYWKKNWNSDQVNEKKGQLNKKNETSYRNIGENYDTYDFELVDNEQLISVTFTSPGGTQYVFTPWDGRFTCKVIP